MQIFVKGQQTHTFELTEASSLGDLQVSSFLSLFTF